MSYDGISVSFNCRLCETSFEGVGDFIQHKKRYHFLEFQRIRSIVFEEKIFSDASQDYCGSVLQLPTAPIVLKTETPVYTNTDIDINADYENSYFEHEIIEPELGNLILESTNEVITFENQILENPIVRLKRLSAKKISLLTTTNSGRSRNPESSCDSISQPELFVKDSISFFHSYDDNNIVVGTNEPFPTPVFEKICKQEYTTSSNAADENEDCELPSEDRDPFESASSVEVESSVEPKLDFSSCSSSNLEVNHHELLVIQPHSSRYLCVSCQKYFISAHDLKVHNRTQHGIVGGKGHFTCPHPNCEKTSTNRHNLSTHVMQVHSVIKSFKCPHPNCGKAFKLQNTMKQHYKLHSSTSAR